MLNLKTLAFVWYFLWSFSWLKLGAQTQTHSKFANGIWSFQMAGKITFLAKLVNIMNIFCKLNCGTTGINLVYEYAWLTSWQSFPWLNLFWLAGHDLLSTSTKPRIKFHFFKSWYEFIDYININISIYFIIYLAGPWQVASQHLPLPVPQPEDDLKMVWAVSNLLSPE